MELREVSWVLHHGIRHTGMPAFGSSHSKEDLWSIATFVERFDEMTPARYEQWIKESAAKPGSHSTLSASSRADARLDIRIAVGYRPKCPHGPLLELAKAQRAGELLAVCAYRSDLLVRTYPHFALPSVDTQNRRLVDTSNRQSTEPGVDDGGGRVVPRRDGNVLEPHKQEQILALGHLGPPW